MEAKTTDGKRAKAKEGLWWRWTHGKSGSISSSSHSGATTSSGHANGHEGFPPNSHNSIFSSKMGAAASPGDGMRWQKRTTRSGVTPKEEPSNSQSLGWSTSPGSSSTSSSPSFFTSASSASSRSSRAALTSAKKKTPPLSSRSKEASAKKSLAASSSSTFMFSSGYSSREEKRSMPTEISWSMGKSKRQATRKDRKSSKSSSALLASNRNAATTRNKHFLPDVNEDTVMKAPDAAGENVFSFSTKASKNAARGFSFTPSRVEDAADLREAKTPRFDFDASFSRCSKPAFPPTSPSAASTASTTSSFSSQSFSTVDPLVNCARAVLQDCIMKRKMEQSNARKRSIEGCFQGDMMGSKEFSWCYDSMSKPREYSVMSSGSSSSSDDELSQLSSMDQSFCSEKPERGCDSQLAKEEMYRQILVGDYDLSSSPENPCFSPLFEEKGLPIEIRYQLPLALGTANETSKECTICQLRYGIGDHIVTLPCQHFFHACCVDKWLWNHTSCPLCRTEVSLDEETEVPNTKHNFTECSPVDQERIRRQMRSSSQHAGFRPVVPVEVDELELDVSRMVINDDSDAEDEPSYLVCPTPHLATHFQDNYSGN